MRATRAYIASAGTAAVMLGAAVSLFALLSAFIAFGSWPGRGSNTSVDQIVLDAAQKHDATPVTVRRDAVALARRQAAREAAERASTGVVRVPSVTTVGGTKQLSAAPTQTAGSGHSGSGGTSQPTDQVTKQVQDTTQQLQTQVQDTTQQVQTQVQDTTQQVQTQVEQVVSGVGGAVDNTTTSAAPVVQQVQDTAGGVLGH